MKRRFVAANLFLAAFLITAPAAADPVKLSGPAIKALLSGNTVHGQWAGREYWSFFEPDGWTTYRAAGSKPATGRWGVTASQYCSTWDPGGTSCYDIYRDGDSIVWGTSGGDRYPSSLLTGDRVPQ